MRYLITLLLPLLTTQVASAATRTCEGATKGVLIECVTAAENGNIMAYLYQVLRQNSPYIIAFAVILVIWSGIEYMLANGNSSAQATARKRIVEIVIGIIFYTLIFFVIRVIGAT